MNIDGYNNPSSPATKQVESKVPHGHMQIVANVAVVKLKQEKRIKVPMGQSLGLKIQKVPGLGIGVTNVNSNSIFFNKIQRGDILSEFMGILLKNVSALQFIKMVQRTDVDDRCLVVEYTAASLEKLFELAPGKKFLKF